MAEMSRWRWKGGQRTYLQKRVFSPTTALLILIAACNLFLVHAVLVFLLVSPPYSPAEGVLLWASGFFALALLVYGGVVAWDAVRSLRLSEDRLTELGGRLDAIVHGSPLAITACDREGRVVLWNRAAEDLFGWPAPEVLGRPLASIPAAEQGEWEAVRQRVLRGQTVRSFETRRTTRDGQLLDVSISAAPVRDREGGIQGTMTVITDISERRQVETERQELEEQLQHAQKMEAVGRLAGGVAHDFNNLLTAIKGNAELLLSDGVVPGDAREDLEEIRSATDRAAALTRQLLAFSRQGMVRARPLDLNALVQELERLLRRVIGEDVVLETDLAPGLGVVHADPGQVEQVLMNLVVNARDAMPGGGRIVVRTQNTSIQGDEDQRHPLRMPLGDYVVLSVSDTGMGMEAETAKRVFEPFFTTKPVGVGTGLGLSTAYGIVKQAHGYIWVDTDPGMGSTFLLYLPRVEAIPEKWVEHRETAALVRGGTETILVVEDEEAVLALSRKVLGRCGYRVLTATRGAHALRVAREHPEEIHLLFCDTVLPDLAGQEIVDRIRRIRPGIRVLMTSGYSEALMARQGVMDEDADFLAKPYTPSQLGERVRDVLSREPGGVT